MKPPRPTSTVASMKMAAINSAGMPFPCCAYTVRYLESSVPLGVTTFM